MTVVGIKKRITLVQLLLSMTIVNAFNNLRMNAFHRQRTALSYVDNNIVEVATAGIDAIVVDEATEMNGIVLDDGIVMDENLASHVKEELNEEQKTQLHAMGKVVPKLVEMWLALVIEKGLGSRVGVKQLIENVGPIPKDESEMVHWIVTVMNPLVDIRRAVSSCENDFHKMKVVNLALQASINDMSGNRVGAFRV